MESKSGDFDYRELGTPLAPRSLGTSTIQKISKHNERVKAHNGISS